MIQATEEKQVPTTKKAAKELGFRTAEQWESKWAIPKRGEKGVNIRGDEYFQAEQTEELITKSRAKKEGLLIQEGIEPSTWLRHNAGGQKWIDCDVFRISDCVPIKKKDV